LEYKALALSQCFIDGLLEYKALALSQCFIDGLLEYKALALCGLKKLKLCISSTRKNKMESPRFSLA
jgi:hypothetical protein